MLIPAFTTHAEAVRISSAMVTRCASYESLRQTAERQTLLTLAERVAPCTLGEGSHKRTECPSLLNGQGAWWRAGRRSTCVLGPSPALTRQRLYRSEYQRGNSPC
jgi:hypothetical protein